MSRSTRQSTLPEMSFRRIRWAHAPRPFLLVIAFLTTMGASTHVLSATAPIGDPVDAGSVVLVSPEDLSKAVTHGSAKTPFTLRLPDPATCPGDSANDQWRIQTFSVPVTGEPSAIRYGPIGPEPVGDGHYALFGVDTTPFVQELTLRNPGAGQPGVIPAFPAFSFEVVAGENVPAGSYQIGVACTYFGVTAKYWHTEVVLTDNDGSLRWRLATAPPDVASSDSSSGVPTALVLGGAAVLLAAALIWRRAATRRPTTLAKETN